MTSKKQWISGRARGVPWEGSGGSLDDLGRIRWAKVETGGWPGRGREGDKSPSHFRGMSEEGRREWKPYKRLAQGTWAGEFRKYCLDLAEF